MHGLIFKIGIWQLAGSTRIINLSIKNIKVKIKKTELFV